MKWTIVLTLAARIFGAIVRLLSPEIRELMEKGIKDWEERAAETPNPWDDHLVDLLKQILEIE
jgi:hypothetical protein